MLSTHTNKKLNLSIINTILIVMVIVFAYTYEVRSLHQLWVDSYTYTHGYLVLAISIYLLYKLPIIKILSTAKPSPTIGLILLITVVPFLFAKAGEIKTVQLLVFPFILLFSLGTYLGTKATLQLAFPILILLFSVPIWDDFSPLFQAITVIVNQALLWVFNIPAQIDGLYISLPVGTFFVAGGCSGVKYILVALFLSSVYSYLYVASHKGKASLILTALALSMFSNWIRVFGIILAGHLTNMESPLIKDHEWWGWVIFFLFTLLPLYFIANKIERTFPPVNINPPTTNKEAHDQSKLKLIVTAIYVIVVITTPNLLLASDQSPPTNASNSIYPPASKNNWLGPLFENTPWNAQFTKPDSELNSSYIKKNNKVHLSITHYQTQSQGKELIYYQNKFYEEDHFKLLQSSTTEVNANISSVNELLLENKEGKQIVIWHWYLIGEKTYTTPIKVKLAGALSRIQGDQSGTWLSVSSQCTTQKECNANRTLMENYIDTFDTFLMRPIETN